MDQPTTSRTVSLTPTNMFAPGERPTVSIAVTCRSRPTADFVNHLYRDVSPHVDEIVIVAIDDLIVSPEMLNTCWREWRRALGPSTSPVGFHIITISPKTHPHAYVLDVPETYLCGEPLAGESYAGPYSGQSIVSDWSLVKNLGWSMCSAEWRVPLDENEHLHDPELLSGACAELSTLKRDSAYTRLTCSDGRHSLSCRFASNVPSIAWEGQALESIEGQTAIAVFDSCLSVTSHTPNDQLLKYRDSWKILYAYARQNNWDVPTATLLHLAKMAPYANMSSFVPTAIRAHLDSSLCTEERACACSLMGEHLERLGQHANASEWHLRSLCEHPGLKLALRLARSRFKERDFQGCVSAYEKALELQNDTNPYDDGPETLEKTLVLAASSLHELGHHSAAKENSKRLRELFPNRNSISTLCNTIE